MFMNLSHKDVKEMFDILNYKAKRLCPNKKNISLMKDELDGEISKEFAALQPTCILTEIAAMKEKGKRNWKICNQIENKD